MFGWWGRVVVRGRWWVLAATVAVVLVGGVWGTGIFGALGAGGFEDPDSPSSVAGDRIAQEIGRQGQDVIVLYTNPAATVDEPGLKDPVATVLANLGSRPEVTRTQSYYATPAPSFVSADRHSTYVVIQLREGDMTAKRKDLAALRPALAAGGNVTTEVGGGIGFLDDANRSIEEDIVRAETLSLPILLVLLIFIFRGLIAAATPVLVGIVAILGAFTVTRILASVTEVSVFAANVITMLGLGMAIDYALFIVNRFREELANGHPTPVAIQRTIATAGRTVVVSGVIVALALSSLLLFPFGFLKSMAYGGMSAVLVAMIAALTALPAFLTVLGPRINSLRVPLPRFRPQRTTKEGGWARLARSVMRRPVIYLLLVGIALLGLGTPFLRAQFGGFDERVLPEGTASRTVAERLASDFHGGSTQPVVALVSGGGTAAAETFAARVATLPHVTGALITANKGESSIVTIAYEGESSSEQARDVVREVRAVAPPSGSEVLVTGRPAVDIDQLDSLGSRLPWMAVYVGVVTFLLLFFAFGSLVLPLKAILMNTISIGASFGVVVWIFQDGYLSDLLGFTSTGFLEPTNLILMLAVLFGLSTDYEVFLMSRIREEWDRSGSNVEAVTAGIQRTGGIITAAALLLIIVIGGFATGGATTIKMLGIGTVVAVALDATLVRMLLVPATMRLLGRFNWWAPGPLARVYRRYNLREEEAPARELELTHAG